MSDQYHSWGRRLVELTLPLAECPAISEDQFHNVLLGINRVSHETLQAILDLTIDGQHGSSALTLSRKSLEYAIAVEYMIFKGARKYASRLQDYLIVETHKEINSRIALGQDPRAIDADVAEGVEAVTLRYENLGNNLKKHRNWAGCSIEEMIVTLHSAGKLTDFDSPRVMNAYTKCCQYNHVSSTAVRSMMDPEMYHSVNDYGVEFGLIISTLFHYRISCRWIDNIRGHAKTNVYKDIESELQKLWLEMDVHKGAE